MTPEERAIAKLKATTAITDLVNTRIYPAYRPEDSGLPAISYLEISDVGSGYTGGAADTAEKTLDFTFYASTYSGLKALKAIVISTLDGFTDADGNEWHAEEGSDGINDLTTGEGSPSIFTYSQVFSVWYSRI